MTGLADQVSGVVAATGTLGTIIIAFLIGMALVFIVMWRGRAMLAGNTTVQQANDFQDRLIKAVEALTASEGRLRDQVGSLLVENAALRGNLRELTTSVDLLRNQMRAMIAQIRAVKEGRLAADAIEMPDQETDA